MLRLIFALFTIFPLVSASTPKTGVTGPELLTFDDLTTLADTDQPPGRLAERVTALLTTPFVSNQATLTGTRPHKPVVDGLGPVLRVVSWNIERGVNLDLIRLAFTDSTAFRREIPPSEANAGKLAEVTQQLALLRDADVIILNEVDLGMMRTNYRDIARELANALGMNYAFGVEFIELDKMSDLGLEPVKLDDPALSMKMQEDLTPDPGRYKGLHGNAILSRYSLENVRIVRLPVCYDWYHKEKAEISQLEKGKRLAANTLFLERIEREVRQGGRMALLADIIVPDLPFGRATVVSAHLESKCQPGCRTRQMDALLAELKSTESPVIIGGDLNTTGIDHTPTSIRRELMNRVKDYDFWVTQALKWATPASLPLTALEPVNYFRTYLDPTSRHLPIVGRNKEANLFRHIARFRFADQGAFDFHGDVSRTGGGRRGTLANSNQRARKGFVPTFTLKRDFGGLVGRYKLDWFFVKPALMPGGDGSAGQFAPHFPMTLRTLNNSVPGGVSDHAPIVVDLPLTVSLTLHNAR